MHKWCSMKFPWEIFVLNKFECHCLPGYEPKSPKDWNLREPSGGCIRKRLNSSFVYGHGEGFIAKCMNLPPHLNYAYIVPCVRLKTQQSLGENGSGMALSAFSNFYALFTLLALFVSQLITEKTETKGCTSRPFIFPTLFSVFPPLSLFWTLCW